jgi:hypothetical protein
MFHTIEICQEIAKRMGSPKDVCDDFLRYTSEQNFQGAVWQETSIDDGLPGIVCFYAAMDQLFPTDGWKAVVHDYLELITKKFEDSGYDNYSLFTGLCGLCFSVHMCSKQGVHYQTLQTKLEMLLIEKVEQELFPQIQECCDKNLHAHPHLYSLANGISGILAYLLLRLDIPRLHKLAIDCVSLLLRFLNRSEESANQVPAWYVSIEHQLAEEEKAKFPEGSFILGTPLGITGCLSALALSSISGLRIPGLNAMITRIANWLKEKTYLDKYGVNWRHTIPYAKEGGLEPLTTELDRETWWYGTPAVTRSLYLAAKATSDQPLAKFAEKTFSAIFAKNPKDWNNMGPALAHGKAGLLAITYRMAQDTQSAFLWKQVDLLEAEIKGFYRPNSQFGYQMVYVDNSEVYHWIDHPGLLTGASGIALSLLLAQRREELIWDRIFLIN